MEKPHKYEGKVKKLVSDQQSGKRVTMSQAIRCKCLDCMGFQYTEVTKCPSKDCPLWSMRMGKNTSGSEIPDDSND